MSRTIDQRVVEMQFNNKNFEKNVKQTMTTLDKLKEKLNLNGASRSLEQLDAQSRKLNFSGISAAADTISNKFSALEIAGITALARITNAAIDAGTALVKSLSIDQIAAGFDKFGKKTTSVSTLQAQGFAIEEVNEQLDKLNWFTDETSYNYTDMVDNISKFTATGKGLTESVKAMEGIATWAALSGQNAQKASSAMYQLSQALSAGFMRKEDYKSIQNVNMDTQEFRQKALDAAVALKTVKKNADGTYKSLKATGEGARNFTIEQFAETLTEGKWFTSDVMMSVFNEYSKAVDEIYKVTEEKGMLASEVIDEIHNKAKTEGISTNEAIKALGYNFDEFALKAFEAAQKARTFGDAVDATRDAVSTSWMKTFEIIFGNAEEATELWTDLANALWDVFASGGEARNEMLKGWKDLGGRDDLVQAFWNLWEAISSIITPIKEAFRDIFPKSTSESLFAFTKRLKEVTEKLKISEKSAARLKEAFKGLFAVLRILQLLFTAVFKTLAKIIYKLTRFATRVLLSSSSLSEFIIKIKDTIEKGKIFDRTYRFITKTLDKVIDKIELFGKKVKENFKAEGYKGFVGILKAIYDLVIKVGLAIGKAFGGVVKAITKAFDRNGIGDAINSGLFSVILVGIYKLINNINKPLTTISKTLKNFLGKDGVSGLLTELKDILSAYQEQIKSKTLMQIATAVGILAASIFLLSRMDAEALGRALAGITVLFGELLGAMALFSKVPSLKGAWRAIPLMLSMSTALLTLSIAMRIIGTMSFGEMMTGLVGIAGGMAVLIGALHLLPEKVLLRSAFAIKMMSGALLVLSLALKIMGSMDWGQVARSLTAAAGGLALMVGAVRLLPKDTGLRTLGMLGLASALTVMATALKIMGTMSWGDIGRSLAVLAGSLVAIIGALNLMPKGSVFKSIGLIGVAAALNVLAIALKVMGTMDWIEIGKGLTVLGGALLILSIGLNSMKGTFGAAAALTLMSGSLLTLTVVLRILGAMKWSHILKGLVALAGAFAVLGIAAAVLKPLVPAMLTLAGSFALVGLSAVALGAGLMLIGTGISVIAASLAVGATTIVASLTVIITGILNLIPTIAAKIAEGIATFAKVIGDSAPTLVDSAFKLLAEVLKSLAEYIPIIANALFDLLIGVIDVLTARMPELAKSFVKFLNAFFVGVAEALGEFDGANLLKGVIAVGIMSGLVYVLASVSSMIGPAMLGLLGVGALIAELALILAAIGALNKIPGLSMLIDSGGYLLQAIGTAIGQFIGGIAGGIAKGFSNSLPEIGMNLAEFMKNITPFIEGASKIDESMAGKIKSLVKSIKAVSNEKSLGNIGKQLVPFGKGMVEYSDVVKDLDTQPIIDSASAAKAIVDVANAIPNSGGLGEWFTGNNDLDKFAEKLIPFGEGLVEYSKTVAEIKHTAIVNSASAARALAEVTQIIPNEGGMAAWFAGENSVAKFGTDLKFLGKGLKSFADETADVKPDTVTAAANAAKALAEVTQNIPNEGGMLAWFSGENSVSKFGDDLTLLGKGLKSFADETASVIPENITAAANAAKSLAEMTSYIPNSGGMVAWFTGENSVAKFGGELPKLGKGLKGFSDEISGIVPENIVSAADAAKSLAEMAEHIPNEGGVASWFAGENSVAKFAGNLPGLGEGLKGFSDKIDGINPDNVVAAANAAKALAEMSDVIPNEGGIVAWFTGENSMTKFAGHLPELGKGLKGFSDKIDGINPENVKAAATAAKSLAEMADKAPKDTTKITNFGGTLTGFGDKLKSYFSKIKDISDDSITLSNNVVEAVKNIGKDLDVDMLKNASKGIDEMAKSLKELSKVSEKNVKGFNKAMKELAKSNIKEISDTFNDSAPKLKSAGASAIDELAKGIKSKEKTVKDACSTITKALTNCEKEIKKFKTKFYNVGADLVTGFANGINDNTYKSTAKAIIMAKEAETAARETLRINSPSKVFMKIGSGIPEGMAKGITKLSSSVKNSVSNMSDMAISGTTNAMSQILDAINTDVDTQPSIRPVLDLTDVQAGANKIGELFNNTTVGSDVNLINKQMNARSQNGFNNDIVTSINELRKDLGNLPKGDTYNVNGVTYDDGSNIREAVETIIRAAVIERRS